MSFLAEIRYDEVLVLLGDLKKEGENIRQTRIFINKMLKHKGNFMECKATLRSEKNYIKLTLKTKIEEKEEAENHMKLKKMDLEEHKAVKTGARSNDCNLSKYPHINHVESVTLNSYKIS